MSRRLSPSPSKVLVVDDNPDILIAARMVLKRHFSQVKTTDDPARLGPLMAEQGFDLVLLDMNFRRDQASGEEGMALLAQLRRDHPATAVVMMTAYGELELAVRAMKAGAADFVTKPWDNDRLLATLQSADPASGVSETHAVTPARPTAPMQSRLLGHSPAMQRVMETIEMVAPTEANVLILGESGTGKAVVADAIHAQSARAGGPMVNVDMGTLSDSLMGSELFGHVKGAFTDAKSDRTGRFEAARGGTLFLDELGNLPLAQQSQLLTAIQNRQIQPVGANRVIDTDIRLVCATNDDLNARVAAGSFRQDLLYRINTVVIALPPLRQRQEDIPLLAEHFLRLYQQQYGRPERALTAADIDQLRTYPWPGNVRELAHAMERLVILSGTGALNLALLELSAVAGAASAQANAGVDLDSLDLAALEQLAIEKALHGHQGNISRAAKALGLTRAALYRRMEKYGL
ncbi:sigma-54 dependent transcriptional regulator [Ferrimonas pelagia]|uniref:Sigma-54 dependent transcriptional regulator n=1 Tax=Ferrimonas pelagia TaxID=1177826 RepID=A0ABP9FAJ5_9GAMM